MKPKIQKVSWVMILALVGLLSLTVLTAAEGLDWHWSSDPGAEPQSLSEPDAAGITLYQGGNDTSALQPDDNGYTDPVFEASPTDAPSNGSDQTAFVDWDALIPEDAPDQPGQNIDPNAAIPQYFRAAGSTLRPRNSSYAYATDPSGGCLYLTSGDAEKALFNIPMPLPDGAIIKYFRVYYYDDTLSADGSGWITRYDNTGNSGDIWTLKTSGEAGYGTAISTLIDHEVDTASFSYVLNWRPRLIGDSMRLCGMRVNYIVP